MKKRNKLFKTLVFSKSRAFTPLLERILSIFILGTFTFVMTGTSLTPFADFDDIQHDDGTPCQDGDAEGPCNDECLCICCPGHFSTLNTVAAISITDNIDTSNYEFTPLDEQHPEGILRGIFRPPRS